MCVLPAPDPPTPGQLARQTILEDETPDAAGAFDRCAVEEPPLFDLGGGQAAACWLAEPDRAPPMVEAAVPRAAIANGGVA